MQTLTLIQAVTVTLTLKTNPSTKLRKKTTKKNQIKRTSDSSQDLENFGP